MTKKQKKMLWRILAAAALMIGLHFVPVTGWLRFGLYLIPYLVVGYDILRKAAIGIWNRQVFDENFLMAVATVGALILGITRTGDYMEVVAVMLFYQLGELFQSYAVGKSRRSIGALMDIRPDYANVEVDGVLETVDPDEIAVGTLIAVQPGERVPIDGVVRRGCSSLDTAALTGESLPRDVGPGDEIISGCINMTGLLTVETTKEFGASTVSRILDLVENASSRKSRSEDFISKFARVYTPAVCYAALALALLPPVLRLLLGLPAEAGEWFYRALTFLVISCPCALVISIPLSFFAGIGGASREGVLVKGSNFLEALARVDRIAFDKTGTLTQGVFGVREVYAAEGNQEQLLFLAAHAECASSHPIGQSIVRAYGRPLDRSLVSGITEIGGEGVSARVAGRQVSAGNARLMERLGLRAEGCPKSGTVVHVAADGRYAGYILVADKLKPGAGEAVAALKKAGVKRTVMLTGDSVAAAMEVSGTLGITEYYSELLPADKVARVEELLQEPGGKLAFVGDGINDAPVLSRADIGIAMGALGSDAAIEAADVVLMDDDPRKIAKAIQLARKCMNIVRQNIVFALGVKALCLVLGAFGLANMWLAIFADVGVMVLAVLNAIRALFVKKL